MAATSGLGAKLRELRGARGFTQDELAFRSGVPQATISTLESGRVTRTSHENIEKLAAALGVTNRALYEAAGLIEPTPTDTPPPPADKYESPIAEEDVVRYIEALPGHAFQERLAHLRASLPPASYTALCLRLYRAWMSNGELALDAYSLGRS